eukprot:2526645-Alexandrium_andersonii.AAC.1
MASHEATWVCSITDGPGCVAGCGPGRGAVGQGRGAVASDALARAAREEQAYLSALPRPGLRVASI